MKERWKLVKLAGMKEVGEAAVTQHITGRAGEHETISTTVQASSQQAGFVSFVDQQPADADAQAYEIN